ncbi:MAG: LamG domain-containing protein [Paludibacter sp.]
MKSIKQFFLAAILLMNSALAFGAVGDFGSWVLKTGHAGMACDKIAFTGKSLTLELWLNLDAGTDVDKVVIALTMGDGKTGFALSLRTNSAHSNALEIRFFVKTPSDGLVPLFIPKDQFVGKWGHMAFVVSETEGKAYAYVNGELYTSLDAVGGWIGNNANTALAVGKWYTDPQPFGKIADFRIWKTARTAEQIKQNFNKHLEADTTGLYINYTFAGFQRGMNNLVGTNNKAWLSPELNWNTYHAYEVLTQAPTNVTLSQNQVSWEGTGESWEVQVLEKNTNNVVVTDTVTTKSLSLDGLNLATNVEYYAKVRTKNLVYSGWASSLSDQTAVSTPYANNLKIFSTDNGTLIIKSDIARKFNIYAISGQLIRTVNLLEGDNEIAGLKKGFYVADNQKIFVK